MPFSIPTYPQLSPAVSAFIVYFRKNILSLLSVLPSKYKKQRRLTLRQNAFTHTFVLILTYFHCLFNTLFRSNLISDACFVSYISRSFALRIPLIFSSREFCVINESTRILRHRWKHKDSASQMKTKLHPCSRPLRSIKVFAVSGDAQKTGCSMRILRIANTRFLSALLRHRASRCVLSLSLPAIGAKILEIIT